MTPKTEIKTTLTVITKLISKQCLFKWCFRYRWYKKSAITFQHARPISELNLTTDGWNNHKLKNTVIKSCWKLVQKIYIHLWKNIFSSILWPNCLKVNTKNLQCEKNLLSSILWPKLLRIFSLKYMYKHYKYFKKRIHLIGWKKSVVYIVEYHYRNLTSKLVWVTINEKLLL